MTKLKNPLFSLDARNTLGKVLTFVKRRGQNIVEKKPELVDRKTILQLQWRHMYQKCAALWQGLTPAEQADWNALGGVRHMTGFAYWQSKCLRPNPGIYLPLQGGTMQGDIDMAKFHLLRLPAPVDGQEAIRLSEFNADIAPFLYKESARVYRAPGQSIPASTVTTIAFGDTRWDTDDIHDEVINNTRLTCKTAGLYLIISQLRWNANAVGVRGHWILFNATDTIAQHYELPGPANFTYLDIVTIWPMAVGDYVEVQVWQTSPAPLNVDGQAKFSPEFMMARIGP